jgi:uncharacterized membrane protein (UPF0127 family)
MVFMVNKKISYIHYAIFIQLAIGAALLGLLFLHRAERMTTSSAQPALHSGALTIPVTIAATAQTREQGLSNTASLPTDNGMLFIFDTPGNYGFWMKDMHYPLDMVWMDSGMNIVTITPHVTVASYPKIFYPTAPVRYVLEVNDGFSTRHDLKVGQHFSF